VHRLAYVLPVTTVLAMHLSTHPHPQNTSAPLATTVLRVLLLHCTAHQAHSPKTWVNHRARSAQQDTFVPITLTLSPRPALLTATALKVHSSPPRAPMVHSRILMLHCSRRRRSVYHALLENSAGNKNSN
jgi:hypothetical protein